jgi:Na+-driven multidrug efflux pump
VLFLGLLGVFFVTFATPVVSLFVDDPAVIPIAAMALRTFACGNLAYAYVMVMLQAFNGAGDTITPTIVYFFGFWVLELPLAWWLAVGLHLGAEGAFLSVVVAESAIAAFDCAVLRGSAGPLETAEDLIFIFGGPVAHFGRPAIFLPFHRIPSPLSNI